MSSGNTSSKSADGQNGCVDKTYQCILGSNIKHSHFHIFKFDRSVSSDISITKQWIRIHWIHRIGKNRAQKMRPYSQVTSTKLNALRQ